MSFSKYMFLFISNISTVVVIIIILNIITILYDNCEIMDELQQRDDDKIIKEYGLNIYHIYKDIYCEDDYPKSNPHIPTLYMFYIKNIPSHIPCDLLHIVSGSNLHIYGNKLGCQYYEEK